MKKRFGFAALAAATTLALSACGQGDAAASASGGREEVTLTFVTGFPEDVQTNDGFWMFRDKLAENAPWITIDHRGGPEVMAPNLMIESVQSGAYDGASLPGDYYADQIPVMDIQQYTPFTAMEERENGVLDIYSEIHEQQGLHLVGRTHTGVPLVVMLKDPIDSPDLTGLNIRSSPSTSGAVRAVGGTPVDMPAGEVYSALERGVIDGATYTSNGVVQQGWQDQLGYYVEPRFYDSIANTVLNLDTWESLDTETQEAITETMKEVEPEIVEHYQTFAAEETKAWQDAGMQQILFEGEDEQRFLEAVYRGAWEARDWERILSSSDRAKEMRAKFEDAFDDGTFSDVVPGGTVIAPQG